MTWAHLKEKLQHFHDRREFGNSDHEAVALQGRQVWLKPSEIVVTPLE